MSTANDQWDIVSSVGWTALMVAAGRAVETHRADGLVDDPWAERFVDRAETPLPVPTRPGQPWPDPQRDDDRTTIVDEFWTIMSAYQGVRSRYFDEALLGAGADQVVLLAAGLDARAFRLTWPAGTTVYEVDQEAVLAFKDLVLDEQGAVARATRRRVDVDLRDDWVAALLGAGFDSSRPSVFLAEGLLPFLPAEAEADLLRLVGTLAAPGSTFVVEHFGPVMEQFRHEAALSRFAGPFGIEIPDLVDLDAARTGPSDQLAAAGWDVRTEAAGDVAARFGRPLPSMSTGTVLNSELVVARR